MKKGYLCAILLAFIAIAPIKSRAQMTMDAQWTVVSNDGHTLKLELGIRTNTPGENLGPAVFIFNYDNSFASYSSCQWQAGFGPTVSAYSGTNTGVTESPVGTVNIDLDYSAGSGTPISDSLGYTPIVDLLFSIADNTQSTSITWNMTYDPLFGFPTFENLADDGYNQFNEGSFHGIGSQPLPINLISFAAQLENVSTVLKWTTASEINNQYFSIERSTDGFQFHPLLTVPGAGNSETKQSYIAYDNAPLPGLSYYRLGQTDFNGKTTLFNILSIDNQQNGSGYIRQTIVDGEPALVCNTVDPGHASLRLTDMSGKTILAQDVLLSNGVNIYRSAILDNLKPGVYLAELINGSEYCYAKLVVAGR